MSAHEFLEVRNEAAGLSKSLRRVVAAAVVDLHANPWLGELLDDRWPRNLEGCRTIRFDAPQRKGYAGY